MEDCATQMGEACWGFPGEGQLMQSRQQEVQPAGGLSSFLAQKLHSWNK